MSAEQELVDATLLLLRGEVQALGHLTPQVGAYNVATPISVLFPLETSSKKPKAEVDRVVKVIQDVAREDGLEPDCIEALMDFVIGQGGAGHTP